MFRIVENRKWYFLLSLIVIIPGVIAMIYSMITIGTPFKMAIDFTGGTYWELNLPNAVQSNDLRTIFVNNGEVDTSVTMSTDGKVAIIRAKPINEQLRTKIYAEIQTKFPGTTEAQFNTVGPSIGQEVTQAAVLAVIVASVVILIFLIYAFRKAPHPLRYGVTAIIAMIHDLLVTAGLFSIGSLLFGWEADALFLTAILTVAGFSVQDTIVVYDRIRENLTKYRGENFTRVVNRSLLETLHRSITIHLTTFFVLTAILIFGGPTIKPFVAVLLIGVTSGTYSSIFNASQLLAGWEEGDWWGLRVPKAPKEQVVPQGGVVSQS